MSADYVTRYNVMPIPHIAEQTAYVSAGELTFGALNGTEQELELELIALAFAEVSR